MSAAAIRRVTAISCMAHALACTPATQSTNAPVEPSLDVPKLGDPGVSAARDAVRFGRVPTTVGERWTVEVRGESRTSAGAEISRYESDLEVEILATSGLAPTRARLRFDRNVNVHQEAERPTVVHGKTYVVDASAPNVRDADGATAAAELEAERVLDAFPDIGTRARIDEVLPEEPMRIGESRDDLAAAIVRVIHPRAWTLKTGSARLARVDEDDAVFAVTIVAESAASHIRMDVSGEARIRTRDSRLVRLALDGSYEGDATRGDFTLRRIVR